MRRRKRLTLLSLSAVLAFVLLGAVLRSRIVSSPATTSEDRFATARTSCALDASRLAEIKQRYDVDGRFDYLSRTIRFRRTQGLGRKTMTVLPQALFAAANTLTVDVDGELDAAAVEGASSEPLQVEVPVSGLPSTVDASDFMFGISTTYQRLSESRADIVSDWQYWLTDGRGVSNGAKLFLTLLEASDEQLRDARALLRDAGIDASVDRSDDRDMPVRYLNLVPHLYRQEAARRRRWLVLCDDDTFFPSMHGLARRLASFDHARELYIGTLSEDVGAVERHGSQAFGGAGVFLSLPMARRISESIGRCASRDKVEAAGWQGDKLLRNCIYENSDTRLVLLPDLWQLDFRGDAAGFYEWGRKPLSLHHYRGGGWHTARPAQFSKIAYACGEDCILQRFQTADHFILAGHSVAHYPAGVTFDTSQVERTFEPLHETSWNFDFVFGPQRPPLKKSGHKISWEIQRSELRPDGSVLQTYLRKKDHVRWQGADNRQMGELDSIIELVWQPSEATA
ncbi:hypothetical protein CDD83_4901 [Cordyceps sp. RAO-2017]|nr:hypothetical protein CDD83_4901 [Cordyceps sp. RAO-2017]